LLNFYFNKFNLLIDLPILCRDFNEILGKSFRPSIMKKEAEVQFFPINCQLHEMIVMDETEKSFLLFVD